MAEQVSAKDLGTLLSYDGSTGRAVIELSGIRSGLELFVDGMEMAQQGINLVPGTTFGAKVSTSDDARGIDFTAIEQPYVEHFNGGQVILG